jgi:hypothetical protein
MVTTLQPPKAIGLKAALDLMRKPGHRLMLMHTAGSPEGRAYYIVPGGYVEPDTAKKIIERPDVQPNKDGLFPGINQTWQLGGVT